MAHDGLPPRPSVTFNDAVEEVPPPQGEEAQAVRQPAANIAFPVNLNLSEDEEVPSDLIRKREKEEARTMRTFLKAKLAQEKALNEWQVLVRNIYGIDWDAVCSWYPWFPMEFKECRVDALDMTKEVTPVLVYLDDRLSANLLRPEITEWEEAKAQHDRTVQLMKKENPEVASGYNQKLREVNEHFQELCVPGFERYTAEFLRIGGCLQVLV